MRSISSVVKLVPTGLGIAAMLAASYGMAQAPGQAPGLDGPQVFLQRPQLGLAVTGCPVFLSANQRSLPQQVETGSLIPPRPTQGLRITLSGRRALRDHERRGRGARFFAEKSSRSHFKRRRRGRDTVVSPGSEGEWRFQQRSLDGRCDFDPLDRGGVDHLL